MFSFFQLLADAECKLALGITLCVILLVSMQTINMGLWACRISKTHTCAFIQDFWLFQKRNPAWRLSFWNNKMSWINALVCLLESLEYKLIAILGQLRNERLFSLSFVLLEKTFSDFFLSCLKLIIHVRHLRRIFLSEKRCYFRSHFWIWRFEKCAK